LQQVELISEILPLKKDVFHVLLTAIPPGSRNFCFCGVRIRPRRRGFLAGTISERLLRAERFNVIALRVVHPGFLGCPENLLLPMTTGKGRDFQSIMPFLFLLAPDIRKTNLIKIIPVTSWEIKSYPDVGITKAYSEQRRQINELLVALRQDDRLSGVYLDGRVVITSDWVKQVLARAGRHRSGLIILEAFRDKRFAPARLLNRMRVERILRETPCDVALCRMI